MPIKNKFVKTILFSFITCLLHLPLISCNDSNATAGNEPVSQGKDDTTKIARVRDKEGFDNSDFPRTQKSFNTLASSEYLKHALVSLSVRNSRDGKVLYSSPFAKTMMRPASTQKVLTTFLAFKELGKDFRFETKLLHSGSLKDGNLKGNLYLLGSGDPSLGSDFYPETLNFDQLLAKFLSEIKSHGIERIDGRILAVNKNLEESVPGSWTWEDLGNYFGAGHHALNMNENAFYLDLHRNNQLGDKVTEVTIKPASPYFDFTDIDLVQKGPKSGDQAYIFPGKGKGDYAVRGSIPVGKNAFTIKGAIPEPHKHLAYYLREALEKNGIHSEGSAVIEELPESAEEIFTHYSPELEKLIRYTNVESVNLYGEAFLAELGQQSSGEASRIAGLEYVRNFLADAGLEDEYIIADGSGLSVRNMVSANAYTDLLYQIHRDEAGAEFMKSLPRYGSEGTLKYTMDKTEAGEVMRGKSGSIKGVISYVGYYDIDGETYAFCFQIDHRPDGNYGQIKAMIETLFSELYKDLTFLQSK